MGTDLFKKYYDNPSKSYIYANILCSNGSSADETSFDINNASGQITDNNGVLSSINLDDIHVGLEQYRTDTRTIEPNSYCYIRGMVFGDSYCSKSFGRIIGPITEDENWMYNGMIFFVIKYLDLKTGNLKIESLKIAGDVPNEITFIDNINRYFENKEIPIEVKYEDGYLVFTSSKLAYEFWIDHMMFWKSSDGYDIFKYIDDWMTEHGKQYDFGWDDGFVIANNLDSSSLMATNVYSSILKKSDYSILYNLLTCLDTNFQDILEEHDVDKIYLFEDFTKYVPAYRYPNGAMLGCLVDVVYPKYNDDEISKMDKAVKIAHMTDRVQEFYAIPDSLVEGIFTGVRKLVNVSDQFKCDYDTNLYNKWMGYYSHININDDWIEADEIPQVVPEMIDDWENSSVSYINQAKSIYKDVEHRDCMGIEGYCAYLTRTGGWMTVGQFYARTTIPDNPEYPDVRNLIPSFIIYNPNTYPVQVKTMIFA